MLQREEEDGMQEPHTSEVHISAHWGAHLLPPTTAGQRTWPHPAALKFKPEPTPAPETSPAGLVVLQEPWP